MKNVKMTIVLVVAVLFMATGQGFGVVYFNDGGTHNISNIFGDVWVDYEALGMQTTVNVLGGEISSPYGLQGYNNSRINISGGYVDRLDAWNSTTVNLSGGNISKLNAWNSTIVNILPFSTVNGPFIIRDNSSVLISGGFFAGCLIASNTSNITITGGNFRDDHATYLVAGESSTVAISGGFVNMLRPYSTSNVAISGGRVKQLSAFETSTTTFYGYDFTGTGSVYFVGDKVMGTGELHGKWLDGTSFTTNIDEHDAGATILAIPEPATLLLLGLGAVMLRRGVR